MNENNDVGFQILSIQILFEKWTMSKKIMVIETTGVQE